MATAPGSAKVFNAQEAGADAVILHSGFGGAPFILATDGEPVTIPAVMVSGPDGDAIAGRSEPIAARVEHAKR